MEAYMRDHMNDEMVRKAAQLYDFQYEQVKSLGGFENFVFEATKDGEAYILRFVHSNHRNYHQVLAELEFIDYLNHNCARVSTVIHSINNNIVEQIEINDVDYFSISVFEKAPGTYVPNEVMTPEFWEMFGEEVGRMHRLTKTFKPKHKRLHWHEENFEGIAKRWLEEDDQEVLEAFYKIKKTILGYPTSNANYGLIHTDLHFHNMYYFEGSLTFFDFDDSAYKHFVSDIAIIIYYNFSYLVVGQRKIPTKEYNDRVKKILHSFMKGYEKQNHLAVEELKHLNEFLLLRSVILYIVMVADGFKHHEDERYRTFCSYAKERALNNLMKLDLDYVLEGL